MTKVAVLILAGTEGHENLGRIVNGLETAKEVSEHDGDDLELLFDGAGTQWIPELEDEESDQHDRYQAVREDAAVCDFCSSAFGVAAEVAESGIATRDDYHGHPSLSSLVAKGYEVITF